MTTAAAVLEGMRVVEMTDGRSEMCGRFLADLGADVIRVEPTDGSMSRRLEPTIDGSSIGFAFRNANKQSMIIDLADETGRRRLRTLLETADVWIATTDDDGSLPGGVDLDDMRRANPRLVVLQISDFGTSGPYATWTATDPVLLALAAIISRSGVVGRPPIIPPGELADDAGAFQAVWAVVVAHWAAQRTGLGDVLDFSRLEGATQILDPAFGAIGTAAASMAGSAPGRGRPNPILYPIFPCRDGHVRFAVLAPRQWLGLRAWLGEPEEFADRKYEQMGHRYRDANRLYPLIADLCRDRSALELVARGQQLGVPVAPVLTPTELFGIEHFEVRGSFADIPLGPNAIGRAPSGHLLIDGERVGIRQSAPALDAHGPIADSPIANSPIASSPRSASIHLDASLSRPRPLEGLRVLDLGVIVAGGETGRLFADQGADVVKVENRNFPDGMRASGMNPGFAATHRNKRSLGVDLRSVPGIALFERLIAVADVVLTNFKPGTLESLGVGYERMREINPSVVLVTSSAMGESGPWRDWMGYGPLVRCVSGMTSLWCDTGTESGFGDAVTVFPDHLVARVVAAATVAALLRRDRTGTGAHIEAAQAETILNALGVLYTRASVDPAAIVPGSALGPDAPWGVYPCAGDDEWCVITARGDADWAALVATMGSPAWASGNELATAVGRVANRRRIDEQLAGWTATLSPAEAAGALQAAGVPAAQMVRVDDQTSDPQMMAREFFRTVRQPGLDEVLVSERGPVPFATLPEPDTRPAPYHGEHSRIVCREWLGLGDDEIDAMFDNGVLQGLSDKDQQTLAGPST